ncbi:MAG: TIGR00730 family Rossman fold protein [Candidatus Babeliales bacterium]
MNWQVIKDAFFYLGNFPTYVYGLWTLHRINKPIVTIFGGKRMKQDSIYYNQAFELGKKLIAAGFGVITGGGPGIMEAGLCGAREQGEKYSLGIGVAGVDIEFESVCNQKTIFLHDFAHRKQLLIYYSVAFIIFPGGIGTLDELLEVMNLMKTNKIKIMPIILINKEYWQLFLNWFQMAVNKGYVNKKYADILHVTDNIDDVLNILAKKTKGAHG